MKIKGQLQWTDYLKSQLLHLQPSGWVRIVVYAFRGVLGLRPHRRPVFCCYWPVPHRTDDTRDYICGIYHILPIRSASKTGSAHIFSAKGIKCPFELEIADSGLNISNEFGYSNRPWGNFIKWKENRDILLLYHSDVLYSILPKRLFADPQQVDTIRAHLQRSKVPPASSRSQIGCIAVIVLFLILAVAALLFQLRATTP